MPASATVTARRIPRWSRAVVYRILGAFLISCGSVVTLSSQVVVRNIDLTPDGGGWRGVADAGIKGALVGGLLGGLGPLMAGGGVLLYNRGRKINSRSASDVLGRTSERPVLYLRSFRDDAATEATPMIEAAGFVLPTIATQEEQIVEILEEAGPVVAVGSPGETLPKLGAARLYIQGAENDWRAEVTALMDRANLIAIRAGTTEGVLWEIEKGVSLARPERLVLLIPFAASEYRQFADSVRHLFPKGLPDWPPTAVNNSGDQSVSAMDIKAVVHFRPQWEGALHLVEPTTRSVKSMRPLKEPFRTALQPVYDGLAISSGRTSSLHWRRLAVTALELSAGLVPGLLLAAQIGPALDPLAERFYSLRIFSKPRVAFLDAVPGLYGAALRQEIRRSERVRAWFETAPVVELEQIGARVASGLPRLSNELLEQRAELVGAILDKLDPESCGIFVRGIAGLSAKSLAGEDVLKLIETYLGPSGINRWAHITVKSLEADLMNLPARRPTQDDVRLAVTELLDRLPGTESVRMAESLQNYASSAPVEMCWVERKINHTRPQLSEVSREALLRAPFGTER